MPSDGYIPVQDLSLEAVEAEAVFVKHIPEIARVLTEQEEGERSTGKITITLKVEIEKKEQGLTFLTTAALKSPGFCGRGVSGHLAPDGRVRVVGTPDQIAIFGGGDVDEDRIAIDEPEH